jgi:hypothetical protein
MFRLGIAITRKSIATKNRCQGLLERYANLTQITYFNSGTRHLIVLQRRGY